MAHPSEVLRDAFFLQDTIIQLIKHAAPITSHNDATLLAGDIIDEIMTSTVVKTELRDAYNSLSDA